MTGRRSNLCWLTIVLVTGVSGRAAVGPAAPAGERDASRCVGEGMGLRGERGEAGDGVDVGAGGESHSKLLLSKRLKLILNYHQVRIA